MNTHHNLIKGACVVVCDVNNNVLTVTRPDGSGVGLPGGKLEPGEDFVDAAQRELWEETGVRVTRDNLVPLYRGVCVDAAAGQDYDVVAFFACSHTDHPRLREPGVEPVWSTWAPLETNSPFAVYNAEVAAAVRGRYPSIGRHMVVPRSP